MLVMRFGLCTDIVSSCKVVSGGVNYSFVCWAGRINDEDGKVDSSSTVKVES